MYLFDRHINSCPCRALTVKEGGCYFLNETLMDACVCVCAFVVMVHLVRLSRFNISHGKVSGAKNICTLCDDVGMCVTFKRP